MIPILFQSIQDRIFPKKRRFARLRKPDYFGRHDGKDFLVLATGPTISTHKVEIQRFIRVKRSQLVIMACNYIGDLCIPDYQVIINRKRFCTFGQDAPQAATLILSYLLPRWIIRNVIQDRHYECVYHHGSNVSDYGELSIDDRGVLHTRGSTVAMIALGTAIVMGARFVYCAGLDGFSQYAHRQEDTHCFKDPESIQFDRRLINEHATHGILKDCAKILGERGGTLKVITPTVYKEFYDGTAL